MVDPRNSVKRTINIIFREQFVEINLIKRI